MKDDYQFARTVTDSGTRGVLVMVVGLEENKTGKTKYKIREVTSNGVLRDWMGTAENLTEQLDDTERPLVEACMRMYKYDGKPKP